MVTRNCIDLLKLIKDLEILFLNLSDEEIEDIIQIISKSYKTGP
jgi:hypothetical protein